MPTLVKTKKSKIIIPSKYAAGTYNMEEAKEKCINIIKSENVGRYNLLCPKDLLESYARELS